MNFHMGTLPLLVIAVKVELIGECEVMLFASAEIFLRSKRYLFARGGVLPYFL